MLTSVQSNMANGRIANLSPSRTACQRSRPILTPI